MKNTNLIRSALATAFVSVCVQALADVQYDIVEIPALPGFDYSSVHAINNSGYVAGTSYGGGSSSAFRWNEQGGHAAIMGFGYYSTRAFDINENGVVAGDFTEGSVTTGLTWHNGGWWHNQPFGGGTDSVTLGINNLNQSVGHSGWSTEARATGWLLGSPGFGLPNYPDNGASAAFRLNDSGDSVGHARRNGQVHASLFLNNNTVFDLHQTIQNVGNTSLALDINNAGSIVGRYTDLSGLQNGFFFNFEVGMVTVGSPGQNVDFNAVNMSGIAAGSWNNRAALWSLNNGRINLNDHMATNDNWILTDARDINDQGWIVGQGTHNGVFTAYLATPTRAVPEPGTMIALAAAVAGLAAKRRSKGR